MKISSITLYSVDIPLNRKFRLSGGREVDALTSTICQVKDEFGTTGWGEGCPFGPSYTEAFASGIAPAVDLLAPDLMGRTFASPEEARVVMDQSLKGHSYAKAPVEMALWDLYGKSLGVPCYALFGGRQHEGPIPLNATVSAGSAEDAIAQIETRRSEGYWQYSPKGTGRAAQDGPFYRKVADALKSGEMMCVDCNGGWSQPDAIHVVDLLQGLPVYIEQPCATLEECHAVRQRTSLPFVLDECILSSADLFRAWSLQAIDVLNMKISRVGGLSAARILKDFCVKAGLGLMVQETAGSEIARSAQLHLAVTVPDRFLVNTWDTTELNQVTLCDDQHRRTGGAYHVSDAPGFGASPREHMLGAPIRRYSA